MTKIHNINVNDMHQLTHIRRNPRDSSSALDAPKGPYGPSVTSTSSDNLKSNKHKMQLKRKRIIQPRRHPPISGILKNISPTASPDHKRTRASPGFLGILLISIQKLKGAYCLNVNLGKCCNSSWLQSLALRNLLSNLHMTL